MTVRRDCPGLAELRSSRVTFVVAGREEVAHDDRQRDRGWIGQRELLAPVAGLLATVRGATIARARVAVVAGLGCEDDVVAADRDARASRAVGLAHAEWRTAISDLRVAVVTLLGALAHGIAAVSVAAGRAGRGAHGAGLELAESAAAIAPARCAEIAVATRGALFIRRARRTRPTAARPAVVADLEASEQPITAACGATPRARSGADPTLFTTARRVAAIARSRVAIVAGLGALDARVATRDDADAVGTRHRTDEARVHRRTVCGAAVGAIRVAVVAGLATVHHAVSARTGYGARIEPCARVRERRIGRSGIEARCIGAILARVTAGCRAR